MTIDEIITEAVKDLMQRGREVKAYDTLQYVQDGEIVMIEQRHIDEAKEESNKS